ncbi:MAG: aminodeoxychorismate/anthranilate synthase component II [Trueperaceae bacterium]
MSGPVVSGGVGSGGVGSARLLVIDNYDSFTYNLVQMLGAIGTTPIVVRNDAFDLDDVAGMDLDGIVVSPGPCTPTEAGLSVPVIRRYGAELPILGVCLGHQAIVDAYGGKVVRAGVIMHGKTSDVRHDGSGVFGGLPDPVTVTRYHSLVTRDLPNELIVNGWTHDGKERVIMGVRHVRHPVWGVQFHPESILTEHGDAMLRTFVASLPARSG